MPGLLLAALLASASEDLSFKDSGWKMTIPAEARVLRDKTGGVTIPDLHIIAIPMYDYFPLSDVACRHPRRTKEFADIHQGYPTLAYYCSDSFLFYLVAYESKKPEHRDWNVIVVQMTATRPLVPGDRKVFRKALRSLKHSKDIGIPSEKAKARWALDPLLREKNGTAR